MPDCNANPKVAVQHTKVRTQCCVHAMQSCVGVRDARSHQGSQCHEHLVSAGAADDGTVAKELGSRADYANRYCKRPISAGLGSAYPAYTRYSFNYRAAVASLALLLVDVLLGMLQVLTPIQAAYAVVGLWPWVRALRAVTIASVASFPVV